MEMHGNIRVYLLYYSCEVKNMTEKRAAVLLADGFEEGESLFVVDIFRRTGVKADSVSIEGEMVLWNSLRRS